MIAEVDFGADITGKDWGPRPWSGWGHHALFFGFHAFIGILFRLGFYLLLWQAQHCIAYITVLIDSCH